MSEPFKQNHNPEVPQQGESDVVALIKKLQQHMVFLEKKIDMLLGQSSERPSFNKGGSGGGRRFSRPFRGRDSHGPSSRSYEDRRPEHHSRERNFDQDRPFDRPRGGGGGENRGFSPRKKPFFGRRKDRDRG